VISIRWVIATTGNSETNAEQQVPPSVAKEPGSKEIGASAAPAVLDPDRAAADHGAFARDACRCAWTRAGASRTAAATRRLRNLYPVQAGGIQ